MSLVALKDSFSSGPRALARELLQHGELEAPRSEPLRLGPSVDAVLPDGGLPRGSVVELASPLGLARATSLAVKACAAAQGRRHAGTIEWCAWIDPWCTLHAPGLHQRGVDLERLLVVRPAEDAIAKSAVRVAASRAFALVVIDLAPPLGLEGVQIALSRWPNVVRRLALAIESSSTTVLLLTDGSAHRALPLPVAMRVELDRDRDRGTRLRIAKDRHGRLTGFTSFDLDAPPPGRPAVLLPPRLASATPISL